LPWKRDLFEAIVTTAVRRAGRVPLTIKIRKGINDDHLTYLEAARIAEQAGVAAITLHARTLEQQYSGTADWSAIETLKNTITSIPILGNGDVFEGEDGPRMVAETGCDGVVVGRGVLGRPWLFGDLEAAFSGSPARIRPGLREVGAAMVRHAELLVDFFDDEGHGCRDFRKHVAWYFKGYPVGGEIRKRFALIDSLDELRALVADLDDAPWPGVGAEGPRGRSGSRSEPCCPRVGSTRGRSSPMSRRRSPTPNWISREDRRGSSAARRPSERLLAGRCGSIPTGVPREPSPIVVRP
jgi:nifR3 family TIM-barrel protein